MLPLAVIHVPGDDRAVGLVRGDDREDVLAVVGGRVGGDAVVVVAVVPGGDNH